MDRLIRMRFLKKVAGRGNLTLPSDIREALEIDEGDIVEFEVVGIVRKQGAAPVDASAPTQGAAPA